MINMRTIRDRKVKLRNFVIADHKDEDIDDKDEDNEEKKGAMNNYLLTINIQG